MPATCQLHVAQKGRARLQCQALQRNRTKLSVILVAYSDLRRRTSDDGHRNYRPRTKAVVIAATRPARALAARSLTPSKPLQRAMSSTASTSKAEACAMSKKRRRDGEPASLPAFAGSFHDGKSTQYSTSHSVAASMALRIARHGPWLVGLRR